MTDSDKQILALVERMVNVGRNEQGMCDSIEDMLLVMRLNNERRTRLASFDSLDGFTFFLPKRPPNLIHVSPCFPGCEFRFIDPEELILHNNIEEKSAIFLTNNVFAGLIENFGYQETLGLRRRWERSIIIFHDYDCHHWHNLSFLGQLFSDFYFPAHYNGFKTISPYLDSISSPIPIGSIQWGLEFLRSNLALIASNPRSPIPLGRHIQYEKFNRRNMIVRILNINIPTVSLYQDDYHKLDYYEKLKDWVAFKCHFIVPVGVDLPIRVFDALVTGGIPIVPSFLSSSLENARIAQEDVVLYDTADIQDPRRVINEANAKFDTESPATRSERYVALIHGSRMFHQLLNSVNSNLAPIKRHGAVVFP